MMKRPNHGQMTIKQMVQMMKKELNDALHKSLFENNEPEVKINVEPCTDETILEDYRILLTRARKIYDSCDESTRQIKTESTDWVMHVLLPIGNTGAHFYFVRSKADLGIRRAFIVWNEDAVVLFDPTHNVTVRSWKDDVFHEFFHTTMSGINPENAVGNIEGEIADFMADYEDLYVDFIDLNL